MDEDYLVTDWDGISLTGMALDAETLELSEGFRLHKAMFEEQGYYEDLCNELILKTWR